MEVIFNDIIVSASRADNIDDGLGGNLDDDVVDGLGHDDDDNDDDDDDNDDDDKRIGGGKFRPSIIVIFDILFMVL